MPQAGDPVDARNLPEDPTALGALLEERSVFGRVSPHQKQAMVKALQARGHTVAMTGDGVNDVLALKLADLGIAMGSGAPATKAVAELVLLDGGFATLPGVVAEGRRVTANIERLVTLTLSVCVLVLLATPLTWRRIALVGAAVTGFVLLFPVPAVRNFYALELPRGEIGATLLVAALGAAALVAFWLLAGRKAGAGRR